MEVLANLTSLNSLKLREEKLDEQLKLVHDHIHRLEAANIRVAEIRRRECQKLKEIEDRERQVEEREKELALREESLNKKGQDFMKLANDKLSEGKKLASGLIHKFESALAVLEDMKLTIDHKFKDIENWESVTRKSLSARVEEAVLIQELVQKRFQELDKIETEFHSLHEEKNRKLVLKEQELGVENQRLVGLKTTLAGRLKRIEAREQSLNEGRAALSASEKEAELLCESIDVRLREVEKTEREFNSLQEEKNRQLVLKEQELGVERKKLLEEVKLKEKNIIDQQRLENQRLVSLKATLAGRLKQIEDRERRLNEGRATLAASEKEAELLRESINVRLREVKKREEEFNSYHENRMRELMVKDKQMSTMREKSAEQQRLENQRLVSLKELLADKFNEAEALERSLNDTRAAVAASQKEAELIRESARVRLREIEKREEEFNVYQEKRMMELDLEQEKLSLKREELIQEVMARESKFDEQDKLIDELLERLKLVHCNVKDIKLATKEFKEIATNGIEINSISCVERKRNELDFKETDLENHNRIQRKGKILLSCSKELELKEQHLIEYDLGSGRKLGLTCSKERPATKDKLQPETNLVEKHVLLEENELQQKSRLREPKYLEKERESTVAQGADVRMPPYEAIDLKLAIKTQRETLERLIRKNFELSDDEISEVLCLSSDPAKLVLDVMELFLANNFGKGDTESNVRRNCILVLDQLVRHSPLIQPCITGEAINLARDWKSKMRAAGENPFEVLGFLHFLAAYKISSCLDKNELLDLLMDAAQCKKTPELYRTLVLSRNMPDLINNLIQKKQYLLASTYIHDCKLEHLFPQAGVLNYSVIHSNHLAKEKCKTENNTPEAQDKATVEEIAALRAVNEHIVKYGLDKEYSPNALRIKINQLEQERKSLQKELLPSSTADQREKQGQSSGSDRSHYANKSLEQRRRHEVTKKVVPDLKPQRSEQVAPGKPSLSSGSRPQQNNSRKRPASPAANVENKSQRFMRCEEEERRNNHCSTPKRRWTNDLATRARSRQSQRSPAPRIPARDRLGR